MRLRELPPNIINERTFDARGQFDDVFSMLRHVSGLPDGGGSACATADSEAIADELQAMLLSDTQKLHDLTECESYSRHVIGTQGSWIGLICRWQAKTQSGIHGHPSFAYYQVIQGELSMDIYEAKDETQATWVETKTMHQGESLWSHGIPGKYDNLIHKVTNEKSDGFTLHLFSENPALGKAFTV